MRSLVNNFELASTSDSQFPLVNLISGIHFAYGLIEREVSWLAELSENFPQLPSLLAKKPLLSSNKIVNLINNYTLHFRGIDISF